VLALKPSAILIERPSNVVENPDDGEFNIPEYWAANQAASHLSVPYIPYDRPNLDEYYAKIRYSERGNAMANKWFKWSEDIIKKKDPESIDRKIADLYTCDLQAESCLTDAANAKPEIINSEVLDAVVRLKNSLYHEILPEIHKNDSDYEELVSESRFFRDDWSERNRIMADNIIKAAKQYPGQRLVVLVGASHRYILRDLLKDTDGIDLKEYWELINVDLTKIPPSPERKTWQDLQNKLLAESPAVCREYWEAVIHENWNHAAELYPPRSADDIKSTWSGTRPVAIVRIGETCTWPWPVTPCIVKYEGGRMQEIRMGTKWMNGKCLIERTLGNARDVSKEELGEAVTSQPSHE
jgi:hypothetical protein